MSLLLMKSLGSTPWLRRQRSIGGRPKKRNWLVLGGLRLLVTRELTPVATLAKDNRRYSSAVGSVVADEPLVPIILEA